MTYQDVYVASAIMTFAMIWVFVELYKNASSKFWGTVWLFGIFAIIDYGMVIERWMWQYEAVIMEFDALTFSVLNVVNWLLVCITMYLGYLLLLDIFKYLLSLYNGRSYGETDKKSKNW